MKKLTAGILASLIGLVSANSAEAAVASTKYVDAGLATKQQKLTSENFKKDSTGKFVTGVTVDADGNVTFTSEDQAAAVYDAVWDPASTNAVQAKVIAGRIAEMASNTKEENKVVKAVTQADGKITPEYGQVTGADIAAETIESANIKDGTIATGDIADGAVTSAKILDGTIATDDIANAAVTSAKIASVTMDQVTDLGTTLAGKQAKLTTDNQGDNVQFSFDAQGNLLKISATDTKYSEATADVAGLTKLYAETGAATNGTMTQAAITTALGNKQNTLTQAANAGEGITISTDGKIAADITQTEFDTALGNKQNTLTQAANAGEGITISEDGKIAADITQTEFDTALGNKQNTLTPGKFISIDQATGAITTTYSAGTGIKIDETTGAISADNQLNGVTGTTVEGNVGAQVLTRTCTNESDPTTCTYVWESVDRTFGD